MAPRNQIQTAPLVTDWLDFVPKQVLNGFKEAFPGYDVYLKCCHLASLKNKVALDAMLEMISDEDYATHQHHSDPDFTTQNGKDYAGRGTTEVEEGALNDSIPGRLLASFPEGAISEADAYTSAWPRLTTLRRDSLEEAFGTPVPKTLTVYHAGPKAIHSGVFVTTDRKYAQEFLEPKERVWEKRNVPLADFLAYGDGRIIGRNRHTGTEGVELIYSPSKTACKKVFVFGSRFLCKERAM